MDTVALQQVHCGQETMIWSVLVVVVAHDVEVEHQQGDLQGVVVVVHDIELVLFEVREDLCLVHEAYQYFRWTMFISYPDSV